MHLQTQRGALDVRTGIAILGAIVGLFGGFLTYLQYRSEQPNLFLRVSKAAVRSSTVDVSELGEELSKIEEAFGQVTGLHVIELRNDALTLNADEPTFRDDLQEFATRLQDVIRIFDVDVQSWTRSDIEYQSGTLVWPDGARLDLLDPFASLLFPFPDDALEAVRANRADPGTDVIDRLREVAYEINGYSADDGPERRRVASELRRIRTQIVDAVEQRGRRLYVDLTVENRSRLPSLLLEHALMRVYVDSQRFHDVQVRMSESIVLPAYSVTSLTFESKHFEALDLNVRDFLTDAVDRNLACLMVVQDLNRKYWWSQCRLSDQPWDGAEVGLQDALNKAFRSMGDDWLAGLAPLGFSGK